MPSSGRRKKDRKATYGLSTHKAAKRVPWHDVAEANLRLEYGDGPEADALISFHLEDIKQSTVASYGPQFVRFVDFCTDRGLAYLPADPIAIEKWVAFDLAATVNAKNLSTYLRPINKAHAAAKIPRPALGERYHSLIAGIKRRQYRLDPEPDTSVWLPCDDLCVILDSALTDVVDTDDRAAVELFRAKVAVVVDFCHCNRGDTGVNIRPGDLQIQRGSLFLRQRKLKGEDDDAVRESGDVSEAPVLSIPAGCVDGLVQLIEKWNSVRSKLGLPTTADGLPDKVGYYRLPWEMRQAKWPQSKMNEFIKDACAACDVTAPAGFRYTWHQLRHGAATGMSSLNVPLVTAKTFGRWSLAGTTYETVYSHPAPATLGARRLFGWMLPDWQLQHPGALPLRL